MSNYFKGLGFCMFMLFMIIIGEQTEKVESGYAPSKKPDLPKGFCDPATGIVTETTGECMCNWQHKDGCVGSGCKYQMGLSWYHYSCKDCRCVPEP